MPGRWCPSCICELNIHSQYRLVTLAALIAACFFSALLFALDRSSTKLWAPPTSPWNGNKVLKRGRIKRKKIPTLLSLISMRVISDTKVETTATAGTPHWWAPVGGLTLAGHCWFVHANECVCVCVSAHVCARHKYVHVSVGVRGQWLGPLWGVGGRFAADSLSCVELWEKKS